MLMCGKWRHSAFPGLWSVLIQIISLFVLTSSGLQPPTVPHTSSHPTNVSKSKNYKPDFDCDFFFLHSRGKSCREGLTPSWLKTRHEAAFFGGVFAIWAEKPQRERGQTRRKGAVPHREPPSSGFSLKRQKKLSSLCVCLEIKSSGTKGTMGTAQRPSAQRTFSFHFCVCASYGWVMRRHHMSGLAPMVMHNQWGKCFPFISL